MMSSLQTPVNTSACELDPLFVKALKLLQSKSKDSTEKLKNLLEDIIQQRKVKTFHLDDNEKNTSKHHLKKEDEHKKETLKRDVEKIKSDLTELSALDGKRPKREPSVIVIEDDDDDVTTVSKTSRKSWNDSKTQEDSMDESSDTIVDSEDNKTAEPDDFSLDLGLTCSICRTSEVSSSNQLIECLDCHRLYHQECHKPPVTEEDINDPRFVWYCSRCTKSLKKMAAKPVKPKVPISSSTTSEHEVYVKTSKPTATTPSLFQFKRSEAKMLTGGKDIGVGSAAKPMSGLESLAANLSGRNLNEHSSVKAKIDQTRTTSWAKSSSKGDTRHDSLSGGSSTMVTTSSNSKMANWTGSAIMASMTAEKKLQFVARRAASSRTITDKKHYK